MAIWMYPITQKENSAGFFELVDGRVDATSKMFSESILNGKLKKDPWWEVSNLYKKIKISDEVYIYGGKGYGLVGRAIVINKNDDEKQVQLGFNLDECRDIIAAKIYIDFFENLLIKRPGRLQAVVELDAAVKETIKSLMFDSVIIDPKGLPDLLTVKPIASRNSLFKPQTTNGLALGDKSFTRYSKNAKIIGDRAEEIVVRYLEENLSSKEKKTLKWLAKEGKTPGYDLMYNNLQGKQICIEVKGTNAKMFNNFYITINEWKAAAEQQDNYYLYLVAECLSTEPQIQVLKNPFRMHQTRNIHLETVVFKVSKCEKE